MISFIVIGKNIEHTIDLCLQSVFHFIKANCISEYEVIYVDSDSSDTSVKLAEKYKVKILIIQGNTNSAIGRNQGAAHSSGNILFFVDGDMEIQSAFYKAAFTVEGKLKYPFCTGDLYNKYYDIDYNDLNESSYEFGKKLTEKKHQNTGGGFFVIEKKYWMMLDGMDERFGRNEDLDFYLRMSKLNKPALRYGELFAIHHTVKYFNKHRLTTFLTSEKLFYYGLLIRKHIFNKKFLSTLFRGKYSFLILLLAFVHKYLFFIYFLIQIGRTIKKYEKDKEIVRPFILKIVTDIYCLIGLLFFYPSPRKYRVLIYKH